MAKRKKKRTFRPELLTLEHSRGDGGKHRKEIGVGAGIWFYTWLKKNNFPQDLGTLFQL